MLTCVDARKRPAEGARGLWTNGRFLARSHRPRWVIYVLAQFLAKTTEQAAFGEALKYGWSLSASDGSERF